MSATMELTGKWIELSPSTPVQQICPYWEMVNFVKHGLGYTITLLLQVPLVTEMNEGYKMLMHTLVDKTLKGSPVILFSC